MECGHRVQAIVPGAVPGEELGRAWLGKPKFLNGQKNGHVDFANNWRVGFHNGHVDLAHSACGSCTLGMWISHTGHVDLSICIL